MNLVILNGRVGKDPALAKGQTKGAHFSLAVTERYKKAGATEWTERVTWINIQVWGNFADFIMKYIRKGDKVLVKGKISVSEYNNKTYTNVIADVVEPAVFNKDRQPIAAPQEDPSSGGEAPSDDPADDELPF